MSSDARKKLTAWYRRSTLVDEVPNDDITLLVADSLLENQQHRGDDVLQVTGHHLFHGCGQGFGVSPSDADNPEHIAGHLLRNADLERNIDSEPVLSAGMSYWSE